jgi:hypothetical protein
MRSGYLMELSLLLRRTRRIAIAGRTKIFFVSGAILLAGCSNIPSAYNPVDWTTGATDEVSGWFSSKPNPEGANLEPPPADGRPYPNLGMVPKPPPRATPEVRAQRAREVAALQANRESALAADTALRATGTAPGGSQTAIIPPAPVAVSPSQPPAERDAGIRIPSPGAGPAQRVGAVGFVRGTATPTVASQSVLQAAVQAAAGSGRVNLVPAQFARATLPELAEARAQAMVDALTRAGMPADRIAVASDMGSPVEVYDVYVER